MEEFMLVIEEILQVIITPQDLSWFLWELDIAKKEGWDVEFIEFFLYELYLVGLFKEDTAETIF